MSDVFGVIIVGIFATFLVLFILAITPVRIEDTPYKENTIWQLDNGDTVEVCKHYVHRFKAGSWIEVKNLSAYNSITEFPIDSDSVFSKKLADNLFELVRGGN